MARSKKENCHLCGAVKSLQRIERTIDGQTTVIYERTCDLSTIQPDGSLSGDYKEGKCWWDEEQKLDPNAETVVKIQLEIGGRAFGTEMSIPSDAAYEELRCALARLCLQTKNTFEYQRTSKC